MADKKQKSTTENAPQGAAEGAGDAKQSGGDNPPDWAQQIIDQFDKFSTQQKSLRQGISTIGEKQKALEDRVNNDQSARNDTPQRQQRNTGQSDPWMQPRDVSEMTTTDLRNLMEQVAEQKSQETALGLYETMANDFRLDVPKAQAVATNGVNDWRTEQGLEPLTPEQINRHSERVQQAMCDLGKIDPEAASYFYDWCLADASPNDDAAKQPPSDNTDAKPSDDNADAETVDKQDQTGSEQDTETADTDIRGSNPDGPQSDAEGKPTLKDVSMKHPEFGWEKILANDDAPKTGGASESE